MNEQEKWNIVYCAVWDIMLLGAIVALCFHFDNLWPTLLIVATLKPSHESKNQEVK